MVEKYQSDHKVFFRDNFSNSEKLKIDGEKNENNEKTCYFVGYRFD
jgi:hypothetical protein